MTWLADIISGATDVLPWQVDDVISGGLDLVKGATSVLGQTKDRVTETTPTQGFGTLPSDIQTKILEQVRAAMATPRAQLPARQLYASEMNVGNIFNNPALIALQQYKNAKTSANAIPPSAISADAMPSSASGVGDIASSNFDVTQPESPATVIPAGQEAWRTPSNLIERLTGGDSAYSGWDEETQTYMPVNAVYRSAYEGIMDPEQRRAEELRVRQALPDAWKGQSGYRMAEEKAMRDAFNRINPNSRENTGLYATKLSPSMPAISQELGLNEFKNPVTGDVYNKERAINALLANDMGEMQRQRHAAWYTGKQGSFFNRTLVPLIAAAIAAPVAAGAGTVIAGATGSALAGSAAKYGTKLATSRGMQ